MNTKEVLGKNEMSEERIDKYFLKGLMLFKQLQNPEPRGDFKQNLGEKLMSLAEQKQGHPNFFLGRIPYIAATIAIVFIAVISIFLLPAKQPSQNNTRVTHSLDLPSTLRSEGSIADIKTVRLKIPTGKASYNLFNSIISFKYCSKVI